MNRTTKIIRQAGDHFIAETADGRLRVGILATAHVDTPHHHDRIRAVAAIADDADFIREADRLFDDTFAVLAVASKTKRRERMRVEAEQANLRG